MIGACHTIPLVIRMPYAHPTQLIVLPVSMIHSIHASIPDSGTQILRVLMHLHWIGMVKIVGFVH